MNLGFAENEVELGKVIHKLKSKNKQGKLAELNRLCCTKGTWLWALNQLRNRSIHKIVINKHIKIEIGNHESTVHFLDPLSSYKIPMVDPTIEYMEKCLGLVDKLLEGIRANEPILRL